MGIGDTFAQVAQGRAALGQLRLAQGQAPLEARRIDTLIAESQSRTKIAQDVAAANAEDRARSKPLLDKLYAAINDALARGDVDEATRLHNELRGIVTEATGAQTAVAKSALASVTDSLSDDVAGELTERDRRQMEQLMEFTMANGGSLSDAIDLARGTIDSAVAEKFGSASSSQFAPGMADFGSASSSQLAPGMAGFGGGDFVQQLLGAGSQAGIGPTSATGFRDDVASQADRARAAGLPDFAEALESGRAVPGQGGRRLPALRDALFRNPHLPGIGPK